MLAILHFIRLKLINASLVALLMISLNHCTTDRRKEIQQNLDQIKQEALRNEKSLDSSIIQIQSKIEKIDTLIILFNIKKDSQKICNMTLDLLDVDSGLYLETLAIRNSIKTDAIKQIKDFEKKETILDLYESYKDARDFDVLTANFFLNNYANFLKNNFDQVCNRTKENSQYQNELFVNRLKSYKRISENRIQHYLICLIQIENYLFCQDKSNKEK